MPEQIWFIYTDNEDQCITYFSWPFAYACKQTWCDKENVSYVYQNQHNLLKEDQCVKKTHRNVFF